MTEVHEDDDAEHRRKEAPNRNEPESIKGVSGEKGHEGGRAKPSDRLAARNKGTDTRRQDVEQHYCSDEKMRGLIADMSADNF